MVCGLRATFGCFVLTWLRTARQAHRPDDAPRRIRCVPLLYHLDTVHRMLFPALPPPTTPPLPRNPPLTNTVTAIRRRWPPTPRPFPSPRLGDPYPRDSHPRRHRCGRKLLERCHDQEWEEEGGEGEGEGSGTREEEELSMTALLRGRGDNLGGKTDGVLYMFGSRERIYSSRNH